MLPMLRDRLRLSCAVVLHFQAPLLKNSLAAEPFRCGQIRRMKPDCIRFRNVQTFCRQIVVYQIASRLSLYDMQSDVGLRYVRAADI